MVIRRRYNDRFTWKAVFSLLGLMLLALLLSTLQGCASQPNPVLIAPDTYAVPAVPTAGGSEIAGLDESDRIATVVVPPSDKPTTVRVYKKKVSAMKKALTNAPRIDAVSDNPLVAVQTPKRSKAWQWLLLVGLLAAISAVVAHKVWNLNPWALALRLFTRIFRRQ
jgi:hypothetical protein